MFQITILFLYLLAALGFAHGKLKPESQRSAPILAAAFALALLGIVIQGIGIFESVTYGGAINVSLAASVSLIGFQLAVIGTIAAFSSDLRGVSAGLLLLAARGLLSWSPRIRRVVHDPEIVLGELVVPFSSNSIARRGGVACESHILIVYLWRIAADTDIGTMAVIGVRARRPMLLTVRPATGSPWVVSWSHRSDTFCRESVTPKRTAFTRFPSYAAARRSCELSIPRTLSGGRGSSLGDGGAIGSPPKPSGECAAFQLFFSFPGQIPA